MTIAIKQLANDTILHLESKLSDAKPVTIELATKIIHDCLHAAFLKVDTKNYTIFYKQLSLQLHPDKLCHQEKLYASLQKIGAITIPQQILNNFKETPKANVFFDETETDPANKTKRLLDALLEKYNAFFNDYKRYPEPVSTLVNILIALLLFTLHVVSYGIAFFMAALHFTYIRPLMLLEKVVVNLLTGFRYDKDNANLAEEPIGFDKIRLFALSIFNAIKEPLADNKRLNFLQITIFKPLQVLLTPFVLAACTLVELSNYTFIALVYAINFAIFFIMLTGTIILNTPLYVLDAIRYIIKGIDACFESCSEGTYKDEHDTSRTPKASPMKHLLLDNNKQEQPAPEMAENFPGLFNNQPLNTPVVPDKSEYSSTQPSY